MYLNGNKIILNRQNLRNQTVVIGKVLPKFTRRKVVHQRRLLHTGKFFHIDVFSQGFAFTVILRSLQD